MKPLVGPFVRLLYSRKFLIFILDVGISIILYFGGKYAGSNVFADVKFLIGVLQPVAIAIIMAVAWEDSAEKRSKYQ